MSDGDDELDLRRLQERSAVLAEQRDRARALLRRHQFSTGECPECGAYPGGPEDVNKRAHNPGCAWAAVLAEVDVS